MITEQFVQKMEEILGASYVTRTNANIELYSYDASLISGRPGLVVFPANTEEVSAILKEAYKANISSVARGFATNLSGGTIIEEGLVICLSRLDQILEIDINNKFVVAQSGVTNLEVQDALAPYGCFYAPDPASQKTSTIGGNIGENSGGPRCLKYGVTENHILGVKTVMADGEIIDVAGPAFDPPGYDIRGLTVGAEGCIGISTEITMRVTYKAESIITMLAVYDSIADAAKSVSQIIGAGIVPNTLEMMDNTIIKAVEKGGSCGYPTDAAAVLIIEVEGISVGLKEQAEKIKEICMATHCREVRVAKDQAERDLLWKGRRSAFGAVSNLAPNYLVNDGCVPRSKLPKALEMIGKVSEKYGCPVGNVFHAGDGNLHPLLMFDSRNQEELKQVHKAGWEIMEVCAELGGTITGEHGIGREKQEAMKMIFSGHDLNTQQKIKLTLDPKDLMNPGKVIPLPPQGEKLLPDTEPTILKRPGGKDATGVSEARDEIKRARETRKACRITGGGTHNGYGNISSRETMGINTQKMNDVIEYDAENAFITAGSGMKLIDLQRLLQENNQWLRIRPPFTKENSTLGGVVATGLAGPERVAFGAPRDLLLGLQYIDSEGEMVCAGGKVMKNVAGYDMTRLLTGSCGTFGLITEATWQVATRPEVCMVATATGSFENCCITALKIVNSQLESVFATVTPKNGAYSLQVGFEGVGKVVDEQLLRCGKVINENGLSDQVNSEYPVVEGYFTSTFDDIEQFPFVVQADLLLTKVSEFYKGMEKISKPGQAMIDVGCGRIYAGFEDVTSEKWSEIDSLVKRYQGHVRLIKAPEPFRKDVDVFGSSRPDWKLTHQIKNTVDPDGIFSPGALPGRV